MRHFLLGLMVVAAIAVTATPAQAHGHHRGPRGGFYFGYAARPYNPYWRGYYPRRPVYYPAVPVYPPYPAPPPPPAYYGPRAGFSYFSPGFSFSFAR